MYHRLPTDLPPHPVAAHPTTGSVGGIELAPAAVDLFSSGDRLGSVEADQCIALKGRRTLQIMLRIENSACLSFRRVCGLGVRSKLRLQHSLASLSGPIPVSRNQASVRNRVESRSFDVPSQNEEGFSAIRAR